MYYDGLVNLPNSDSIMAALKKAISDTPGVKIKEYLVLGDVRLGVM